MKPPKTWREYVERITFDFPIKILLKAERDPHTDGERLLVTLAGVPDVYEPGKFTNVYMFEELPPFEQVSPYDRGCIVRDAIIRHLEHEVDECLRFDNKQLRDPHANDPR